MVYLKKPNTLRRFAKGLVNKANFLKWKDGIKNKSRAKESAIR